MHTPEVVFMGTRHIQWALSASVSRLDQRITDLVEGRREFITEEQRMDTLSEENLKASRLGTFSARIRSSLDEYTKQYLDGDQIRLRVLTEMLYLSTEKLAPIKRVVSGLYRQEHYLDIAQILGLDLTVAQADIIKV